MAVVQEAYINGVSTRKVERLVEQLGVASLSTDQGRACAPAWMSRWQSSAADASRAAALRVARPHSVAYTERLVAFGVQPSVGSVGDALDNAMAEAFVGTIKKPADPGADPGELRGRQTRDPHLDLFLRMKVKCLDGLGLLWEDHVRVRVTDQLKGRILGLRGLPRCRAAQSAS